MQNNNLDSLQQSDNPMVLPPEKLKQYTDVTVCASFVAEPLNDYLIYWSNQFDLYLNVSFSPYNQVFQELLNPGSLLNKNKGINILFIRVEDWIREQKDKSILEQNNFLHHTHFKFLDAITQVRKYTSVPFFICIVPPSLTQFSNSNITSTILEINSKLESSLKQIPWFYIVDLTKIAILYDTQEIFDSKSDELGHIPFTTEYYAALGTYLARRLRAYKMPSYKVIALDCDNTLWKGICGEEGSLNVIIDKNYKYLQEFLMEKFSEGFLLVLCSKNNENDVWEVFDHHPQMMLHREHIAAHRINWNSKPLNLISITKELNLGLNSFIFIDDSNFEVEQVSAICPDVFTITLPKDSNTFFTYLNHIWEFDVFQKTEEDVQRNNMYKAEKERKKEQANYSYLNDFLKSLNIQIELHLLQDKYIDRAFQLIHRTNQFNLNGNRKTLDEIYKVIHEPNSLNWIIDVKDRFGDYGNVGLILAREIQNTLVIDTFLLSCRILGRNVEDVILTELQKHCISNGLDTICAQFQPTEKNQPFFEFLKRTNWVAGNQTNDYNFLINKSNESALKANN